MSAKQSTELKKKLHWIKKNYNGDRKAQVLHPLFHHLWRHIVILAGVGRLIVNIYAASSGQYYDDD